MISSYATVVLSGRNGLFDNQNNLRNIVNTTSEYKLKMMIYFTLFLLVSHCLAQRTESPTKEPQLKVELKQLGESKCDALFESVSTEFMLMFKTLSKNSTYSTSHKYRFWSDT